VLEPGGDVAAGLELLDQAHKSAVQSHAHVRAAYSTAQVETFHGLSEQASSTGPAARREAFGEAVLAAFPPIPFDLLCALVGSSA
jgi:hypothetical protein